MIFQKNNKSHDTEYKFNINYWPLGLTQIVVTILSEKKV